MPKYVEHTNEYLFGENENRMTAETLPLSIDGLTVHLGGARVLDDVSFTAGPASLVGVVGPNGAGKSTLFNSIVGLLSIDSGRVLVHGRSIEESRGRIAYVPQKDSINWPIPMYVWDVVMQGRTRKIGWLRRSGAADREAVSDALEQTGMWERRNSLISELSGGQRQRVFVARALAQGADILLLDEAFSGVDVASQATLVSVLHGLRDEGATILMSLHDIGHVLQYCDQCLCINCHVCAWGAPSEALTSSVLRELYTDHPALFQYTAASRF